jgi:2-(3-amino-3-carboxypropyl)histidine synthase
MDYDLELDSVVRKIKEEKAKTVMIQLPDGLKPNAKDIFLRLKQEFGEDVNILFWAGSAFGACDIPLETEKMGVDLIIHFGHSEWY